MGFRRMVAVHTEIEKAGGEFVLGKDVVNMDWDM